ncbi:MAG: hypothetical protein N2V72_04855 [Methanophagales archaeon]|nr:hypothetical protein [Methanophagales archaeon]
MGEGIGDFGCGGDGRKLRCVTPCIAVDNLKDNTSTDETLLRESFTGNRFVAMMPFYADANATIHAHRMPFDHPRLNEEDDFYLLSDSNVSIAKNINF